MTMLLRANCLAKGNSGVRVELVERLLDLLNHDVLPFIPERGSCGASGDLAPLSYVGRALSGDGAVAFEGETAQGRDVLAELGTRAVRARGQGGARAHQRHLVHERVRVPGGRRRRASSPISPI